MSILNTYHIVLLSMSLLLVAGCAALETQQGPPETLTKEDRIRLYSQDRYRTFNGVVRSLENQGFSLETTDSNQGLIFTNYQLASTVGAPIAGNAEIRVEAVLEDQEQSTRVMLTLRIRQEVAMTGGDPSGVSQIEAKQYYQKLFEAISNQLAS